MTLFGWQVEFTQPLWFAVLAALPLLLLVWRRSLVSASPGRKILSLLLRGLIVLLIAAGLAGPKATQPTSMSLLATNETVVTPDLRLATTVLTAPSHVHSGEPFSLELLVRSQAVAAIPSAPKEAMVKILRDGQPLAQESMQLVNGDNHKSFDTVVLKPSQVVFEVRIKSDQDRSDDVAACAVCVDPPRRVLLITSQPAVAEHFKKALAAENIEVEVRSELPGAADQLRAYDLIMLSNVPVSALPEPQMKALQVYVRDDRGGLIAIGGDHSFTVGGYRHTTLEEILPVISEERKNVRKPALAMVLVVDISGSMNDTIAGNAKIRNIDLAKEALRTAVKELSPRDQVGVLVFEDRSRWIWPLSPVTDKKAIIARIDTIEAEGSTNMYPPLEKAYLALREAFADLKHIIVMTDGLGEPGDFDGLAEKIAAAGITMTTVGVGSEPAQGFLKSIADKAKGRSIIFPDASQVPNFFKNETNVAAKTGITEEPFFPQVVHTADVLRGIDMTKAPTLLGYVETQAKPESRVVLASRPSEPGVPGEPILAVWRYGGGNTAAFTSDIQSRWAAPWLNWPGFSKFWAQLVRQTMRRDAPPTLQLETRAANGRLNFTLDATDGEGHFINGAGASVAVNAGGQTSTVPLTQIAPGRYAGSQAAGQGTYWLEGQVRHDGKLDSISRGAVVLHIPDSAPKVETKITATEKVVPVAKFLWSWLLGAGLFVLVIDLAVRRTTSPAR